MLVSMKNAGLWSGLALAAFFGCGGVEVSSFGEVGGVGGDMTCDDVEIPGCEQVDVVCTDGPCECGCVDNNTGGGTDEGDTTTTGDATTGTATGNPTGADDGSDSDTTGGTGMGTNGDTTTGDTTGSGTTGSPLGDCVSVDVWDSCAAYCAAILESCTPGGCDGGTVHYYNSGADCDRQVNADVSDQACGDPLETSGGVSFARCCCQ